MRFMPQRSRLALGSGKGTKKKNKKKIRSNRISNNLVSPTSEISISFPFFSLFFSSFFSLRLISSFTRGCCPMQERARQVGRWPRLARSFTVRPTCRTAPMPQHSQTTSIGRRPTLKPSGLPPGTNSLICVWDQSPIYGFQHVR